LSLAGRYDDYDGLDARFNPKAGFDWSPILDLRVYGTWGKSFVAPNMGLITSIFGVPQPGISDRVGTATVNSTLDIYNLGGGNPDLQPENAKSHTFGVNWKPEFVEGLNMGVTYYHTEYSNLIYKPTRADVLRNPAFSASYLLGVQGPANVYQPLSAAYVAQLVAAAPPQTPITPGQTFNMSFNSFAINIGSRIHAGYDFNIRYDFNTGIGKLGLGVVANKQTKYEEQVVPGQASFSRIGTSAATPWAASFQADWGANSIPLRVGLTSNYRDGFQDIGFTPTAGYLTHNLTVAYDFESLFRGVTAQVRVRNLTDESPPFYNVAEGYQDDVHTPYGRQFDLTLRAKF
jgi:iron complex outermembrane receptor protein